MHCGQKFKFDVLYVLDMLQIIEQGGSTKNDIQNILSIGKNKIDTYLEWLLFIDSIKKNKSEISLTNFGKKLLQFRYNDEFLYPFIYSKLCRGWENGGHFYFSRLVNDILYETAFSINNTISFDEAKEKMLAFKSEIGVQVKDFKDLTRQALTSLIDEDNGFGKMGLVKEIEDGRCYVSFYEPHYLVAAYVIFDRWDDFDTAFKFKTITKGDYNLGRIFFMFEEDVHLIFEKMKQENLISIEVSGGLNQIGKNPNVSKDEILEEMLKHVS